MELKVDRLQCFMRSLSLTSAWLPGARVLLHLSQRRQGLCQSLPRELTFSAETQRKHRHFCKHQATSGNANVCPGTAEHTSSSTSPYLVNFTV